MDPREAEDPDRGAADRAWTRAGLTPRPYQERASDKARARLKAGKGGMIVAPTGSGKSLTIADIALFGLDELGVPVVIVQPTRDLIDQNLATLVHTGVLSDSDKGEVSVLANKAEPIDWPGESGGRMAFGSDGKVILATASSLIRNDEAMKALAAQGAILIFDECHRAGAPETKEIVEAFRDRAIGLTATPVRVDNLDLGTVFASSLEDAIIDVVSYREAVEAGAVVPAKVSVGARSRFQELVGQEEMWALADAFDLAVEAEKGSNVEIASQQVFGRLFAEDASKEEKALARKMAASTVQVWEERGEGRQTIVHAENLGHARYLFEAFQAGAKDGRPLRVAYIDADRTEIFDGEAVTALKGAKAKKGRKALFEAARRGEIDVVVNRDVLREGIDIPSASCTLLAAFRRTLGPAVQIFGRTARSFEDKEDHLLIDTGTTLATLAAEDERFRGGELDMSAVAAKNRKAAEIIAHMGFFMVGNDELGREAADWEDDQRKRSLKAAELADEDKASIASETRRILSTTQAPELPAEKVDLTAYTGQGDAPVGRSRPHILPMGDGLWGAVYSRVFYTPDGVEYQHSPVVIARRDALSKIAPALVPADAGTAFPPFVALFSSDKPGEPGVVGIDDVSKVDALFAERGMTYTASQKTKETLRAESQPSSRQAYAASIRFEPVRRRDLSRLVPKGWGVASALQANLAISLSQSWPHMMQRLAAWSKEGARPSPLGKRAETASFSSTYHQTLVVSALPEHVTPSDHPVYVQRAAELAGTFRDALVVGDPKSDLVRKVADALRAGGTPTTPLRPEEFASHLRAPDGTFLVRDWTEGRVKMFGVRESTEWMRVRLRKARDEIERAGAKASAPR